MPSSGTGNSSPSRALRRGGGHGATVFLAVATVLLTAGAVLRLPGLAGQVDLVSPKDPYVRLDRAITAEFGMQHPVVWIIEARRGTVWTPPMLARVQALTREVFTIPGSIGTDVVSLASPNLRDLRVTADTLQPTYLMGKVPKTPAALAALRQRVENDPNYHGTLVSEDGTAAMVVANFRDDADFHAVAAAALALRKRYSDGEAAVYVTGAPVLGALVPRAARPVAAGTVLILGVGLALLAAVAGTRATLAATLAVALACLWTAGALSILGNVVLPWTAYALPSTAVVAVAAATAGRDSWRTRFKVALALGMGFVAFGVVAGGPAAAFGAAGAAGCAAGVLLGGYLAPAPAGSHAALAVSQARMRLGAVLLVGVAVLGLPRLHSAFGLFGYGARYLPRQAAADLYALERHFPPPTILAIRFRGQPGFVTAPAVLEAFDGLAGAVRSDPAVVRVLSLADVVKMVHRAFHGNRQEFLVIPKDRGLIARYLALAYSPGFRRFVDRAFTRAAFWVYLSSDSPTVVSRVLGRLQAQLAAHPVPGTEVDLIGGSGAVVLVAARAARSLATGAGVLVLVAAIGVGLLCGARRGAGALLGGLVAGTVAAGACGWLAVPIDLVSLPCLIATVAAGTAFGALGNTSTLMPTFTAMALLAFGASFAGANVTGKLLAALLGALAVAGLVTPTAEPRKQDRAVVPDP
ncbi:MAG: hypothetical protein ACE5I7_09410 [Candidatus Binatia bacterium]